MISYVVVLFKLRFCVNRTVPTYLLEHYHYSAVIPHVLRARVVIVHMLVPVRAYKYVTCFYMLLCLFA